MAHWTGVTIIGHSALTPHTITTYPTHGSPMCTDMVRCAQVPGAGPATAWSKLGPSSVTSTGATGAGASRERLEQQQPLLGDQSRSRGQGGPSLEWRGQTEERERDHHNADITSSQPAGLNYKYHVILTLYSRICLIVNITAEISVLNIFMQSLQFNVWNTRSLGEALAWTRRLQASARPGLGPSPSPGPQSLVCSVASTPLFSTPQHCCIAPPHSSYTSVKTSDFNPHCCGSSLDYKGRVFVILTLSTYQQINRSPTELLSFRTCLQQQVLPSLNVIPQHVLFTQSFPPNLLFLPLSL